MALQAGSLLAGGSTHHVPDVSGVRLQAAFLHHHNTWVTATDLPVTACWGHLKASRHPLLLLAREPWGLPSGLEQHEHIFLPSPVKAGLQAGSSCCYLLAARL